MTTAEIIHLWPEGPPTRIEGVPDEVSFPLGDGIAKGGTSIRNVSDPTLSIITPPSGTGIGVGIIVVPGGGWTINMWTHEGTDVADWLVGLGYTAFILKYRVQATEADQATFEARAAAAGAVHALGLPVSKLPRAISDVLSTDEYQQARAAAADDGRRAIEIARAEAARLGVRPESIGMIGFSAGAFLAVDVALDPRAEPLAFIAPIYGGETLGAPIPADAPPLFAAVARDDVLYKIVEGLHVDWSMADRSSELHVFARGQHGFGLVEQGMPSDRWTDLFLAWLADVS